MIRLRSRESQMQRWHSRTWRSEEHTSELQSQSNLVCRLLLEKKKKREKHMRQDGYNLFQSSKKSSNGDHLIDSGTGAMSDMQRAGMKIGDESYAGSESLYNFE